MNGIVRSNRRSADDIFFSVMALLTLVIVLVGFAQSYFLAGMVRAKLPNVLVHVHGALSFSTWASSVSYWSLALLPVAVGMRLLLR